MSTIRDDIMLPPWERWRRFVMESIRLTDWLTIGAILLAPLFAIQVERILEALKERRRRKLTVFHTLMATRGARLSPAHVEALNRIDIEFGAGIAKAT
jgi:hypothetical protein